jgi:acid stress-induced BolA-like protein IbaG/YrbA
MIGKSALFGLWFLCLAAPAGAQEWADKMFETRSHNFGSVAHYAKVQYEFIFTNVYMEDVHLVDARPSCHCTDVQIKNPLVKTYEKGSVVATFNTSAFLGVHGATITVTLDRPFPATVQLQVNGVIRDDVSVNPAEVVLGDVDLGSPVERRIMISGRPGWQVTSVQTTNPNISASLANVQNTGSQVNYEVRVVVNKNAPVGYIKDHLLVYTNDAATPQFPVLIEGRVVSSVTVSPTTLYLGALQAGEKVTKPIVVQGKQPFRIVSVTGDGTFFQVTTSGDGDQARPMHVVPVTITAGPQTGKAVETLRIKTDLNAATFELPTLAFVRP